MINIWKTLTMPTAFEFLHILPNIPISYVICLIALGALALAGFTIHAVLTLAKGKGD